MPNRLRPIELLVVVERRLLEAQDVQALAALRDPSIVNGVEGLPLDRVGRLLQGSNSVGMFITTGSLTISSVAKAPLRTAGAAVPMRLAPPAPMLRQW